MTGEGRRTLRPFVEEFKLPSGKRLIVLGEGRLINLAAAEGHPAIVMDMSFANQALSAEYVVQNAASLEKKVYVVPKEIDDKTAAKMMLQGMTAEYLLFRTYKVKKGDTVLWHAAAGGVGLIACQWLKQIGATVIGTVGSPEKGELAKKNGAHHISCPYPDHADQNPSLRWDARKARAFCTCITQRGGHSILEIVKRVKGLDFEAAKLRVAEILGRGDLIETKGGQRMDAASLLQPPADQRDETLGPRYLAYRLGVLLETVPMPSTTVVGWRSLAYYAPPAPTTPTPTCSPRSTATAPPPCTWWCPPARSCPRRWRCSRGAVPKTSWS